MALGAKVNLRRRPRLAFAADGGDLGVLKLFMGASIARQRST